jgi:hypothetical protein
VHDHDPATDVRLTRPTARSARPEAHTGPSSTLNERATITRRAALRAFALASIAASIAACATERSRPRTFWTEVADAGRNTDPTLSVERAVEELDLSLGAVDIREPSRELGADVERRIRDDFASGRTMIVSGWMLSRTEVLIAVIAADVE